MRRGYEGEKGREESHVGLRAPVEELLLGLLRVVLGVALGGELLAALDEGVNVGLGDGVHVLGLEDGVGAELDRGEHLLLAERLVLLDETA